MPRTPSQNQAIKDKRRAKLVVHSLKSFATYGFDHTSVDDITKSAKCSHGLFYHYFDSIEDAYKAVINDRVIAAKKLDYEESAENWKIGLKNLLSFVSNSCKEGGREVEVVALLLDLDIAKKLDDFGREFAANHSLCLKLAELIALGQKEGKIVDGDPKEVALAVIAIIAANVKEAMESREPKLVGSDIIYGLLMKGLVED